MRTFIRGRAVGSRIGALGALTLGACAALAGGC